MRKKMTGLDKHPADADDDWNPISNSAVRELLDHLADELAKEYVRLMKQAAANCVAADTFEGGQGE